MPKIMNLSFYDAESQSDINMEVWRKVANSQLKIKLQGAMSGGAQSRALFFNGFLTA